MTSSNIARSDELDTTSAQNSFYSAPAMSSARDISTAYDTLGQQYPSQRDYFDRSVYPPSNTPLGTPGYAQTTSFTQDPTQSFDMSFMSQPPPTLPVPDRQPTWDSKWKSLFDSSKGSGLPSPSSTASQYQQSCRSDSAAFLAPEYDTARRHSTDTGSNSAKSVKSSYNPVSTVLVSPNVCIPSERHADPAVGASRLQRNERRASLECAQTAPARGHRSRRLVRNSDPRSPGQGTTRPREPLVGADCLRPSATRPVPPRCRGPRPPVRGPLDFGKRRSKGAERHGLAVHGVGSIEGFHRCARGVTTHECRRRVRKSIHLSGVTSMGLQSFD